MNVSIYFYTYIIAAHERCRFYPGLQPTTQLRLQHGGALTLELEAYLTNRGALLLNARERALFGSDIGKFHTQVGIGLKFIIN